MMGTMIFKMNTYVIGFCFMDSAVIASGISFNGYSADGIALHDRVQSVQITGLIFTYRVKDFLSCWNISVHKWLKYYVFMRLLPNKKKSNALLIPSCVTFMVSAIWHGFYPGFLSFFFGAFLMDYHNKMSSEVLGPLFSWCPDIIQNVSICLFYYICCSYFSVSFWVLYFEDFTRIYGEMYYCVHVLLISTLLLFTLLKPRKK